MRAMTQQGLPNKSRISSSFGYVTAEDRQRWDKQRRLEVESHRSQSVSQQAMTNMADSAADLLRMCTGARLIAAEAGAIEASKETGRPLSDLVEFNDFDEPSPEDQPELGF